MRIRVQKYGDANNIGRNVERLRKAQGISRRDFVARLQAIGVDINPTSYSKLEGQVRVATDREVFAIAKALGVTIEVLFANLTGS